MYYPKLKNQFEYLKQKTKNKGKINATVFRMVSFDSLSDTSHLQVQSA